MNSMYKTQSGVQSGRCFETLYTIKNDLRRNRGLYLLVLPVLLFYALFCYKPMYGAIIAFKNFDPTKGIMGSDFVGFLHFNNFFQSHTFWRVLKNTIVISLNNLVFGFPAPIILALLLNEMKNMRFKKCVQTITYLPHFISLVVVASIVKDFTAEDGVINDVIAFFGGTRVDMLTKPEFFVPIYVISDIWQEVGWGTIIYLSAFTTIDPQLYEASCLDGAGRMRQTLHVTLPGILPTIMIMLLLRIGNILNVGFEKIILLYNAVIYDTADVISTFVYRKGLQEFGWSYGAAVGLFNSVINFMLLIVANTASKSINGNGLW